ncbi:AAA family ATPase [Ruegeria sp. R13_0]|nr:AAA family ATPase [Ruegeria sp. R13_0]
MLRRRWRFVGNRTNGKAGNADASKPLLSDDKIKTAQAFVSPSSLAKEQSTVNINPGHTTQESRSSSSLDIYTEHFGLTERPFTLLPDPDFLFWSDAHSRAYTMLEYGILTRAPITLITGEVGTGKTTLLHHLLKSVDDKVRIGMISNAHGDRGELLRWVLMSLDQPAPAEATYVDLFAAFQTFLIDEYANGHRVILIFDEAQNLSAESLEELRMFTNINSNKDELLQLVLVGQPELREIIRRPDMRQFAQRVSSSFHLTAMDRLTVRKYVGHRLEVAGAERNLFGPAATDKVYEATGGVPRLVNQLCDLAMVYAFTRDRKRVSWNLVQQVLDDGAFFASGMPAEESGSLS